MFRGQAGAGTLRNRTTLRFKGEFALTAIENDLFSRPLAVVGLTAGQSDIAGGGTCRTVCGTGSAGADHANAIVLCIRDVDVAGGL
jgi:hypothetical protein